MTVMPRSLLQGSLTKERKLAVKSMLDLMVSVFHLPKSLRSITLVSD